MPDTPVEGAREGSPEVAPDPAMLNALAQLVSRHVDNERLHTERQQLHLDAWRADVGSVEEQQLALLPVMSGFVQSGLRLGALLNGGGILALPAFQELLDASAAGLAIKAAVGAFAAGLLTAGATSLLAFYAAEAEMQRLRCLRGERAAGRNAKNARADEERKSQEAIEQANLDQKHRWEGRYVRRRRWAVWVLASSFVLFALGAAGGVLALLSG